MAQETEPYVLVFSPNANMQNEEGKKKPQQQHKMGLRHLRFCCQLMEEQASAGVTPDMIRMSVGLETLDDILWDIDQALSKSQES